MELVLLHCMLVRRGITTYEYSTKVLWPELQRKKAAAAAKVREKKLAAEWAAEKAQIDAHAAALAQESAQRAAAVHGSTGGPPQRKYIVQKATPTPGGGAEAGA